MEEIEAVTEEAKQNPKNRPAQKKLAESITKLVHGTTTAATASMSPISLSSMEPTESIPSITSTKS